MLNNWNKPASTDLATVGLVKTNLRQYLDWPPERQIWLDWLLADVLNIPISQIIANPHRPLAKTEQNKLIKLAKKLANHYPLPYLLGHQDFYGRSFQITPAVLIPRPESECLIDIIKNLRLEFNQPTAWLDIGTGSGCLIISANLESAQQDYFGGSDISHSALRVAKKNGLTLQAKINWRHGSLLRPWFHNNFNQFQQIVIIANLPYVDLTNYQKNKAELRHEPKQALLSGHDGLQSFRHLVQEIPSFMAHHPQQIIHLLTENEINQTNKLQDIFINSGLTWQKSFPDLTGRPRFNWWHN